MSFVPPRDRQPRFFIDRSLGRAYTRATLSELATAGLQDVRWHMPVDTDFFQPVMAARSPT
jgi:hypothetical protein